VSLLCSVQLASLWIFVIPPQHVPAKKKKEYLISTIWQCWLDLISVISKPEAFTCRLCLQKNECLNYQPQLFLLHDWQADWILELANQNSTIIGVIGWVDLTDPKVIKFFWEY